MLSNLIRYEEALGGTEQRSAGAVGLIDPIDFDTVESRIPFLEDGREEWIAWAFKAAPVPRIFKSHQPILHPPAVTWKCATDTGLDFLPEDSCFML